MSSISSDSKSGTVA